MLGEGQGLAVGPDEGEALWFSDSLFTIKAATASTGGAYTLVEFVHRAGYATPVHVHERETEAFYVLEGHAEMHCGAQAWAAGPGTFVLLPMGVPHWVRVTGDAPLRGLIIAAPAQFERFLAEVGEPARARELPPPTPPDPARAAAAGAPFGIRVLGPPPPSDLPG